MTLGQKFDGIVGGTKKNQWDEAPWECFNYIVGFITNKDPKDLWRATKALHSWHKNGNPKPVNNTTTAAWRDGCEQRVINPPTAEELEFIKESIEKDNVLHGMINVLVYGARKYELENWKYVRPFKTRYFAALIRHLFLWYTTEKIDPDFAENHLHHAQCCLYFLMWGEMHPHMIKEEDKY